MVGDDDDDDVMGWVKQVYKDLRELVGCSQSLEEIRHVVEEVMERRKKEEEEGGITTRPLSGEMWEGVVCVMGIWWLVVAVRGYLWITIVIYGSTRAVL